MLHQQTHQRVAIYVLANDTYVYLCRNSIINQYSCGYWCEWISFCVHGYYYEWKRLRGELFFIYQKTADIQSKLANCLEWHRALFCRLVCYYTHACQCSDPILTNCGVVIQQLWATELGGVLYFNTFVGSDCELNDLQRERCYWGTTVWFY